MNAHTPGPWHIGLKPGPTIYGPKDEQVADMVVPMIGIVEHSANARLIAAAPDLLAVLEDIVETFDRHNVPVDAYLRRNYDAARAAISKARREL